MDFGCGDNSCVFSALNPPGGMGTNGGCRCFQNLITWNENEKRWNREEVRKVELATRALAQKLYKLQNEKK